MRAILVSGVRTLTLCADINLNTDNPEHRHCGDTIANDMTRPDHSSAFIEGLAL